ncbi:MAG: hypothetical protein ACXVZV_11835 [Terriglobales bacterium]
MRVRKTRLSMPGFAFLVVLLATTCFAEHLKPARHFDVRVPEIYATDNAGPYGMAYLSPGKLAVWFTDNTRGELSHRDKLQPTDPWRMKLQIFDTTTGAVESREYPTHKMSSGIEAQGDGTVTLLNGPLVRCLSPDLRQTGSVNLPETVARRDQRVLAKSPGGHTVWAFESGNVVGAARIDIRSCKLTGSIAIPPSIISISANDNSVVAADNTHVAVRGLNTNWNAIFRAGPCCIDGAEFVNQTVIVAYHSIPPQDTGDKKSNQQSSETKRSVVFLNSNGKLLLEEPLERGFEPGPIVPSSTGQYVLIATPKPDFSSELLKYRLRSAKYRLWIYNLDSMKRIAEFDVPRNGAPLFAFALSPEGRQVAVLEGTKVAIYDVPRQP